MELATGAGSSAGAFGGMGRGMAEESENGPWAEGGGKVTLGQVAAACLCLGKRGKQKRGGGREGEWWAPGFAPIAGACSCYTSAVGLLAMDRGGDWEWGGAGALGGSSPLVEVCLLWHGGLWRRRPALHPNGLPARARWLGTVGGG